MKTKYFLPKLLPVFYLLLLQFTAAAQSYHNEWIDYSKTYYKFKVGPFGSDIVGAPIKNGVVRIPQSTLAAAGLGSVPADQLQLWRNGKEVPMYVSRSSGSSSPLYYIEFWGEIADGSVDKDLFRDSSFQLSTYWSMETDSASYYITVNPSGNTLRISSAVNDVAHAAVTAEKNFTYTTGRYYRAEIFNGYGVVQDGFSLYLSSYEKGEGWSSRPVHPNNCGCGQIQLPQYFTQLYADTSGAPASVKVVMMGNALNDRNVKISFNNDSLAYVNMGYYEAATSLLTNIAANKIKNDSALVIVQDISDAADDEMRVIQTELTYSRKFNFGNASSFEFNIAASASPKYLKITNFSAGASVPVLYDLTLRKRYEANTSVPDTLRFLIPPSQKAHRMVLVRSDGTTARVISSLQPRNFVNYASAANQGNYLVISNPSIYGSGPSNYVEQYRAYRNSAAGGSYNAKLVGIEELEDQFAFGTKMHPLAVKNFLRYARNNFITPPQYAFIIGKGVSYASYRTAGTNPLVEQLNLVPTFGFPGSDNLLSAEGYADVPATPVGRLSAVSAQEVGDYLAKVKQYELVQKNNTDSIENISWTKKVLQLTGANDTELGIQLDTFMRNYSAVISDTLFGANTITYSKTADPAAYPQALLDFTDQYNTGCGLLQYFGHSSTSSIDFNLNDPNNYQNTGKYPLFIVNGCLAGNIFDFETSRKTNIATLSEKFVLAPQKGSIGYLSTSSFGVVNYLDIFTQQFYTSSSRTQYGKGFGDITKEAISNGLNITGVSDYYGRMHAAQYNLHGDPALRLNTYPLPDYALQANKLKVTPGFVSPANDSVSLKVSIYNLGKAISSPVHFKLYKKYQAGDSVVAYDKLLPYIASNDSLNITLKLVPNRDTGTIALTAVVDDANAISELNEGNNRATTSFHIADNDIRPIYPYNYSIVNNPAVTFSASTADPLAPERKYLLELDTTALFNSGAKIKKTKTSTGGVISFNNVTLNPGNKAYYWRVAASEGTPHWNMFSFNYKNPGNAGFEQSHFYQHKESIYQHLLLDSASRAYRFDNANTNVFVKQTVYPTGGTEDADFSVAVNGTLVGVSACVGSSIVFNVFDTLTFKPSANTTNPFGAASPCAPLRDLNFEFSTQSASTRKNAMDFLDNYVPNGAYVVVRKIYDLGNSDWAPTVWAKDTALYGHNNSLYHRFKDQGLAIDSFIFPRTFIFIFRKNSASSFTPVSVFSKGIYDNIYASENIATTDTSGAVLSPVFGPAAKWSKVLWNGTNINTNNSASLTIIASDSKGQDTTFYTIDKNIASRDISGIDAAKYPYIQLRMNTADKITAKPYQLGAWTVEYTPVPEGAVAPNIGINIPGEVIFDHAENVRYDSLQGYITFKNVSKSAFAKLSSTVILYDANNVAYKFPVAKTRKLPAGDTVQVSFLANLKKLPEGLYNLYIEVNPGNDQPEQYHFNNSLYKYIYITRNTGKPLLTTGTTSAAATNITVSAYPNPFSDMLQLHTTGAADKTSVVRIFNAAGQLIIQKTFSGSTTVVTKGLSAGIYMVEVQTGGEKKSWTMQKQ